MTLTELTERVTRESGAATAALALVALALGGAGAMVGLLAGGALTILNFRWLARTAAAATSRRGARAWLAGTAGRFAALLAALAAVLGSGWAEPVAVVAGLLVLPADLVVQGLRAARTGS